MRQSKRFWRALLFIFLLAALCGSFAFPMVSLPVSAAPQMQATSCLGTTIAQWTFENVPSPSTGTGTFSSGSGLSALSYAGGSPGQAISFSNWTTSASIDLNDYVEFRVPTIGRNSISLSFDYRATGTGPEFLEIHYSTDDGMNFVLLGSPQLLTRDSNFNVLTFDFSSISALNDNGNAVFRIYGYAADGASGTLRLDDVTFTGNCVFPADTDTPTSTSTATNTGTATNTVPPATPGVVISEFRTRGPEGANDEFVEIYNPTNSAVDISGWKINASNESGATSTRATIPPSTILRSGQHFLIANSSSNGGYSDSSVPADLTYGTGIANNGGIALLKPDNTIVDQVGMSSGSAYKEGATLVPLSDDANQSYERKPGGDSGSCQDTNVNVDDFQNISPSDPRNYLEPLRLCGTAQPAPVNTTTTITSDSPDPSLVNGNVTVNVTVSVPSSTNTVATGRVNVTITGSGIGCTLSLNSSGRGSCAVVFSTSGTKTITATYLGDNKFNKSSDTESHQVTSVATPFRTPTRTPTPLPPPPLLVINEFLPRPGHDWNNDGIVNVEDEYIEILNHGVVDVNLSGYSLDDEVNIGSTPYRLPSHVLRPGERIVFYGSQTGLLLSDGGDGVRLLRPNGQLMDAYNYFVVGYPDQAFCRLPDNGGADDWNQNCFPTPGLQNSLSGNVPRPSTGGVEELYCPIADTLPEDFASAECDPYGNNIWRAEYWDRTGWYGKRYLPESNGRWPVFAD